MCGTLRYSDWGKPVALHPPDSELAASLRTQRESPTLIYKIPPFVPPSLSKLCPRVAIRPTDVNAQTWSKTKKKIPATMSFSAVRRKTRGYCIYTSQNKRYMDTRAKPLCGPRVCIQISKRRLTGAGTGFPSSVVSCFLKKAALPSAWILLRR